MAAGADCGSVARLDSSRGLPQPRRYFPVAARALAHIAVAVVRAPNEAAARKAAAGAFDVPTHFPPRGGAKIPHCRSPAPVMEQIEESRYDAKGPTEILDPRF